MSRGWSTALLGLALAAGPAIAQENGAVGALLRQGAHWQEQNRPDLALRSFERVLAAEPTNATALAGAARAEAQLGNATAAEALLTRLRQGVPAGDARVQDAEAGLRGARLDREGLAEARRLAQAGRAAEAVARYREVFGAGAPPDFLAGEFYLVLAGTEGGYAEARNGLAALAARGNPRQRLAYAQVLSYREASRAEGVAMLARLAEDPSVGQAAAAAWRQALLWQGANAAAVPALRSFLERHPQDAAIRQRLAEAEAPPPGASPADLARQGGFERLNSNRLSEARAAFEQAIAANPRDAEALGGLGVVRLREGRHAEAQALLDRATAEAPGNAAQWRPALDAAAYATELAEARARLRANDADAAEAALRRAVAREVTDRADAEALLGDVLLRRGDAAAAEPLYRTALARRADFGLALAGLQRALRLQGRVAEAEAIARRQAAAAPPAPPNRANALREQAAQADDETAIALLRAAQASDPENPWVGYDLARRLSGQGRTAEARAVMEAQLGSRPGPDALFAAALFAADEGRQAEAAALLDRIPPGRRTQDMTRLAARARSAGEVASAAALVRAGVPEGRTRLMALAVRPDPSGTTAAAVVRAFGEAGDGLGAEEAARAALAANRSPSPGLRLALAGALLEARREGPAQTILAGLETEPRLGTEERRQVQALQTGLAVRGSDRLNAEGNAAGGFERLRPVLARSPADPAANLALARLYQGARQPAEAARIAETVLARDPGNLDARAAVVDAALAARDLRRAEALLAEAQARSPNEPRVALMEARIARAAGDGPRALQALELAAARRSAQLGRTAGGPGQPFPREATLENPFRPRPAGLNTEIAAPAGDPMVAEIARELAAVREETAPRVMVSAIGRSRSGSGGLDRLTEMGAQLEASTSAMGGRLAVRATPVTITAGDLGGHVQVQRRLGSNALGGSGGGQPAGDQSAAGVGLGLGFQRGGFSADVGTTPLGFHETNVVGGMEVAPRMSDNVRLRLLAERRAVTDSVLSWAGVRDPLTGQVWGGVTRTGGRAQLEFASGPINFYLGGGYSALAGRGVVDNSRIEAGAGASYTVFQRPDESLTAGLDLVYFGYDKNLHDFSLGHGGYFSPQRYAAMNLPVDYRARSGDLSWRIGGTLGVASFREDASPVFPGDPGRQAQLVAASAGDPTLVAMRPG
ncbi:cellulose biosynthesis protein [Siccirubricoccus deserti]|uniref:BCSC C-terminal domain-containing protein n=1 Tax=Siccirubricoccus deserti TaxID=2013562 RepID=A0A9X0UC68_9PROT|nr:BCSC C-terminal domain-containing protein [Siccirubricoccus deserti]GGC26566.1 cellulose biosynthesis protein [Siccirubricoccus deserti]